MRIVYRSWSAFEAGFEIERFKDLPMENEWVDAHKQQPRAGDIYLTTNGYDHIEGPFKKASLYAESYVYLRGEYDRWQANQRKWDHRFHFNPNYLTANTTPQGIGTWWLREMELYNNLRESKQITHEFGMVLGNKGNRKTVPCDFGPFRGQIVQALRHKSFKYFGTKWPAGDPNYGGEKYINGARHTPVKFNDARRLMSGAKFVFAFENTFDPKYSVNYLTEKIWHAFLSCSVPIYAGCWNVEKVLPTGTFIDARHFGLNPQKIVGFCERMMDHQYNGYLERIEEFLNGPGKKFSCDERFVELDRKLTKIFG